jgi:hypothetical protein
MDDRRFDSLVRALAEGKSRRSVFKGLLGLGGAALAGVTLLEDDSEAARRPIPTPTPVRCPGKQTPVNGQCQCVVPPAPGPNKCGPACCTGVPTDPTPRPPGHSECCDNACCFGTCYGEELCCPTNSRTGGLPPIAEVCPGTGECCFEPNGCCALDGCCEGDCFGGTSGSDFCCEDGGSICPGASNIEALCCADGLTCCDSGTALNRCVDRSVQGSCCADADCADACSICNRETNTCESTCTTGELCCPIGNQPDPVCLVAESCPPPCQADADCPICTTCDVGAGICKDFCGPSTKCCVSGQPLGWVCIDIETCPPPCLTDAECPICTTCDVGPGVCKEFCGPSTQCCASGLPPGWFCMDTETCPPPCLTDGDCPICMTCDAAIGACKEFCGPSNNCCASGLPPGWLCMDIEICPPPCQSDDDCPDCTHCDAATGVCGSGCAPGTVCCGDACAQCCGTDNSNCVDFGFDIECVACVGGVCSPTASQSPNFIPCFDPNGISGVCSQNGQCAV